jgi:phosphoribosyl-dephospho-CoA transferase
MYNNVESMSKECLVCNDSIANPVCFRCLEDEVKGWLSETKPILVPKLKKIGKRFSSYNHKVTNCMLCGGNMNVCTQCYCYEVSKLFGDQPKLIEKFIELFNFELRASISPGRF